METGTRVEWQQNPVCQAFPVRFLLIGTVVLLKAIHAMTFRTKFLLFVSICVPPNNPITACGTTSFPGYHSFPKWAIECPGISDLVSGQLIL